MKSNIPILLVEDNPIDVKTVRRAFQKNRIANPLFAAENGEEALAFLQNQPPYEDPVKAPRPGLILLDLHLPVMGGIEFLGHVKSDPYLKTIPVIVLTTSHEDRDRLEAFQHCVAGYIIKPVDFPKFVDAVNVISLYWSLSEVP